MCICMYTVTEAQTVRESEKAGQSARRLFVVGSRVIWGLLLV